MIGAMKRLPLASTYVALISVIALFSAQSGLGYARSGDETLRLTFRFTKESEPRTLLFHPKTQKEMQEILARQRQASNFRILPRPGVSREELAAAVLLARRALATIPADPSSAKQPKERSLHRATFWTALEILAVGGDASDAKRLMVGTGAASFWAKTFRGEAVAYLENRLGLLARGELVRALRGDDRDWAVSAAINLHRHGLAVGDAVLLHNLRQLKYFEARVAATALLDTPGEEVLAAMRGLLDRVLEQAHSSGRPFLERSHPEILYLLAYGNRADWSRLTQVELGPALADDLVPLAEDPRPLIDFIGETVVALKQSWRLRWLTNLCPAFRQWPANEARHLIAYARERFIDAVVEFWWSDEQRANRRLREAAEFFEGSSYDIGSSFCQPNEMTAGFYYRGMRPKDKSVNRNWEWQGGRYKVTEYSLFKPGVNSLSGRAFSYGVGWFSEPQYVEVYVKNWVENVERRGNYSLPYKEQIDYVSHDRLLKAIDKIGVRARLPDDYVDLVLARHRIAARTYYAYDPYPGGAERRPYTLRRQEGDKNFGGALSGLVVVVPQFVDAELRLRLHIEQAAHYYSDPAPVKQFGALIAKGGKYERWDHHKYVIEDGQALLGAIRLRQGDREIALERTSKDPKGYFVYAAKLEKLDLSQLYLEVDLQFFDQAHSIVYDLFASDYARTFTQARERAHEAGELANRRPDEPENWTSWARALRAMGQYSDGWEKYQKALAIKPDDTDLWFEAADMFAAVEQLSERVVEVLNAAIKAQPNSPHFWYALASEQFRMKNYEDAAEAYAKVTAFDSSDLESTWWRATSLFLAGKHKAADELFDRVPQSFSKYRTNTRVFRYISAMLIPEIEPTVARAGLERYYEYHADKGDEREHLYGVLLGKSMPDQALKSAKTERDRCTAHLYVAYRHLFDKETQRAKHHFSEAASQCRAGSLSHRSAEAELKQIAGQGKR